ncbi:MAG: hypothetical protein JWL81_1969 [Verrucomicrobiales bacterium]|nr:hypothetical protein [Verrucomicrobiales bacterium]
MQGRHGARGVRESFPYWNFKVDTGVSSTRRASKFCHGPESIAALTGSKSMRLRLRRRSGGGDRPYSAQEESGRDFHFEIVILFQKTTLDIITVL